jgi:hypothetical protein
MYCHIIRILWDVAQYHWEVLHLTNSVELSTT